jgi:Tol biopolymer transport system component/ribosomal protein L24E
MRHLRPRAGRLAVLAAILLAVVPVVPGTGANAAGPSTRGYWFVASDGGIFTFDDAGFYGSTGDTRLNKPIVGMAPTPSGAGYWFVASDGGIFSFGDATFRGSTGDVRLNKPIVGMAPTPTGKGYWFVASDGGIFSFGDAGFHGSTGNLHLNKPIVGMAATPTGKGYWFVAADGGMFVFGDAKFWGSTGKTAPRFPIVGMASTPSGGGYWLVGSDGSVYAFGDAKFLGSMGGRPLTLPVVGMTPTPSGAGYWLVASDGGIFSFGDAKFHGSTGDVRLNQPIVGMSAVSLNAPALPRPAPGGGGGGTTNPTTSPTTAPSGPGTTTSTTAPPGPTTTTTLPSGPPVNWGAAGATTRLKSGGDSYRPWMSGDGRFVAFDSSGKKVADGEPADPDAVRDIYIVDNVTGITSRVSKGLNGALANGQSQRPTLSADGRFVAFWSDATNLVSGDTNNQPDAFVYDRQAGTTIRVSVASDGTQGNGATQRPVMSRDGNYVAFESAAKNFVGGGGIVPVGGGGDTNNVRDIFVHSMATPHSTTRVSVVSGGGQGNGESVRPSISADGHKIAFHSLATNLVSGDTNGKNDIFVHDLNTGQTTRASVAADGTQANGISLSPSISANGNFVSFDSAATNLISGQDGGLDDVFVKDLTTGAISRVSNSTTGGQADAESHDSSISGDGRFVAWWSGATNIVAGDTNTCGKTTSGPCPDIFVHDRSTGTTRRVSVSSTGAQANNESFSPAMSVDGRFVAYDSLATNLSDSDPTVSGQDIFVHVL